MPRVAVEQAAQRRHRPRLARVEQYGGRQERGFRSIGRQGSGAFEVPVRRGNIAFGACSIASDHLGGDMLGPFCETRLDVLAGCPHVATLHEHRGEQLMHGRMARVAPEQERAGGFRSIEPSGLVVANRLDQ